ncbi:MAG: PAS domain-containing protein [Bacillota bacterium]
MELLHKDDKKIRRLSAFMDELINATTREAKREVYESYKDVVQDVRPIDLYYVDMYKEDSDLSSKAIKATANKFVNTFKEGLERTEVKTHDHPFFDALLEDNAAIKNHLGTMKERFKGDALKDHLKEVTKDFETLLKLDRKFLVKENILFPRLEEKVPSTKPLQVMWSLHDDARAALKGLLADLKKPSPDIDALKKQIGDYYYLVYGIIQKEQLILFPVATKVLDTKTMDAMYEEAFEYGFVFIERTPPKYDDQKKKTDFEDGEFVSPTGSLSFKQVELIFSHLPVDITYVDKHDRVRYFNDRKERHFPRSPSIIGRLVQHCHPPKSVDTVKRIVEAFKNGEKDTADFWIEFKGSFLYIRYFAVRDEENRYEGVLEVSQDVTDIRKLKGQKRLLDWE